MHGEFFFHTPMMLFQPFLIEVGGRREGLDTAHGTRTAPRGGRDDQSASDDDAANGEGNTEKRRHSKFETKRPGAFGTRDARGGQETDA